MDRREIDYPLRKSGLRNKKEEYRVLKKFSLRAYRALSSWLSDAEANLNKNKSMIYFKINIKERR